MLCCSLYSLGLVIMYLFFLIFVLCFVGWDELLELVCVMVGMLLFSVLSFFWFLCCEGEFCCMLKLLLLEVLLLVDVLFFDMILFLFRWMCFEDLFVVGKGDGESFWLELFGVLEIVLLFGWFFVINVEFIVLFGDRCLFIGVFVVGVDMVVIV